MDQELVFLKDDSGKGSLCGIFEKKSGPGIESGSPAKIRCVCVNTCLPNFSSGLQESLLPKQKVLLLPKSEELNVFNLGPVPS